MSRLEIEDDDFENDRLLNREQLKRLLPVSSMTIWRFERDGKLPKHRNIGRKGILARDRGSRIPAGAKMTPLATVTSLEQASNTQWESLLFGRYQTALAVALGSGTFRDAQAALDAWDQWLLINQPDDSRRAAIPTPRVLQDILDREGKST